MAVWLILCVVVFRYMLLPTYIRGESMSPTYRDGALKLANATAYWFKDPRPGDVVVIRMAGRRAMYLKRVLASPGDVIHFQRGALIVNGHVVDEPYVVHTGSWDTMPEHMQPNAYFVAGDNRAMPVDEHTMGIVERSRIVGRMIR